MKSALSDYLVICDMDNTLLTAKEGLPACNKTVIQLFIEMGGLFTVATAVRRNRSARRWMAFSFLCQPSPAMGHCSMISRRNRCCIVRR